MYLERAAKQHRSVELNISETPWRLKEQLSSIEVLLLSMKLTVLGVANFHQSKLQAYLRFNFIKKENIFLRHKS